VIPISHNIGQLEYLSSSRTQHCHGKHTKKPCFMFYARSMEDGTIHVASALNCLGVLHYLPTLWQSRMVCAGKPLSNLVIVPTITAT